MGQSQSFPLATGFSREEISRLEKRFHKLDLDRSGSISLKEFLTVPELQNNPLLQRVVDVFDADLSGEVDFKGENPSICTMSFRSEDDYWLWVFLEFVKGLAQFAVVQEDNETKLRFIFKIYDMDRDGYISNGELFQVLKMMVGKNLTNIQLQQIVDKTILYLDKDDDGKISYEEFKLMVQKGSRLNNVTDVMSVEV